MRIDIITVVPELLESPLSHSIVGRAIKKGLVEIHVHNLRKYGKGPRQQVDDYSYGGDAGMVLMLGSLTPFSKTKQFYLLIDFLLKVFFLSNLIRIFVALYGTIAL